MHACTNKLTFCPFLGYYLFATVDPTVCHVTIMWWLPRLFFYLVFWFVSQILCESFHYAYNCKVSRCMITWQSCDFLCSHPDVFMEAYLRNHWSPLFFVLYLFVTLYFFSNVVCTFVFAIFSIIYLTSLCLFASLCLTFFPPLSLLPSPSVISCCICSL